MLFCFTNVICVLSAGKTWIFFPYISIFKYTQSLQGSQSPKVIIENIVQSLYRDLHKSINRLFIKYAVTVFLYFFLFDWSGIHSLYYRYHICEMDLVLFLLLLLLYLKLIWNVWTINNDNKKIIILLSSNHLFFLKLRFRFKDLDNKKIIIYWFKYIVFFFESCKICSLYYLLVQSGGLSLQLFYHYWVIVIEGSYSHWERFFLLLLSL